MGLAPRNGLAESMPEAVARLREGMTKLRQAYEYARELGDDLWDFAVEVRELRASGMNNSDFRWLVCKGYVEHAGEVTLIGDDRRTFHPTGRLNFCKRTCFVLTEVGLEFLGQALALEAAVSNGHAAAATPAIDVRGPRPSWDGQRQELFLGRVLVKQFKVPAPNQEMVLAAFEEEGWPPRIDDPIPPQADSDPKRRLHDTINSLNRCQRHAVIRFLGDGSGQGVRWELVPSSLGGNGYHQPDDNQSVIA